MLAQYRLYHVDLYSSCDDDDDDDDDDDPPRVAEPETQSTPGIFNILKCFSPVRIMYSILEKSFRFTELACRRNSALAYDDTVLGCFSRSTNRCRTTLPAGVPRSVAFVPVAATR
jgi:hypothetical protein